MSPPPRKRSRSAATAATFTAASSSLSSSPIFDDASTADVILNLTPFDATPEVKVHLHSSVLHRSKYFSTLLSDRWLSSSSSSSSSSSPSSVLRLSLSTTSPVDNYLTVLRLLYSTDFSSSSASLTLTASSALDLIPPCLHLLFDSLLSFLLSFLDSVPWSPDDESRLLSLLPLLDSSESSFLLDRLRIPASIPHPADLSDCPPDLCHDMLFGLIQTASQTSGSNGQSNMAFAKAFVAKILREVCDRDLARQVLDRSFLKSLKVARESLEEYSSPDFRGDHNETEAIQRLNLHTAMTSSRHLLWLIERMIELHVAETAIREWSEQQGFTLDLQRAFRDDACWNIVPGLPVIILRCTSRLALAVASGTIVAPREVRTKFVRDWLPVLTICKDSLNPMFCSRKIELEEAFLKIISTLPLRDSRELLQQCLSFSTRDMDDCSHLVSAFNTWFRRASRPLPPDN